MGALVFGKAKITIAAGGLGGSSKPPVGPGWCSDEGVGAKPLNNVFFV